MKPLIRTLAIIALTVLGSTPPAAAHDHYGSSNSSYSYTNRYRPDDRPFRTERHLIGYDRCGNPVWAYRRVSGPIYHRPEPCPPRRHDVYPDYIAMSNNIMNHIQGHKLHSHVQWSKNGR